MVTEGTYSLEAQSTSLKGLRQSISSRGGFASVPIPSSLEALNSPGCQVFSWNGHQAALICFTSGILGLVPRFILDGSLLDGPGNAPVLAQASGWNTAWWESSGRTYVWCARGANPELAALAGFGSAAGCTP